MAQWLMPVMLADMSWLDLNVHLHPWRLWYAMPLFAGVI